MRAVWLLAGLLSTGCGIAGIVLPLVPTTPFLLLAAYCFARSSPRLHTWLVTHPRLGPPIVSWRQRGAIPRRAKVAALVVMGASLATTAALGFGIGALLLQAAVLAAVSTFILTRPDG